MLRQTFLHLPGIGPVRESALWRMRIFSWEELLERTPRLGLPEGAERELARDVARFQAALARRDAAPFVQALPPSELWRLYPEFAPETAFLDIETTSLSPYEGIVTVVTVHGGGATRSFVADDDLEELPAYLRRFQLLVTFNGVLFDVPFLQYRFPELRVPPAHIDLRFVLYRLGISGGLKRIEQQLGLGDRTGVTGVDGLQAVRLWEAYRRGEAAALDRLVRYNRADTVNLEPLLAYATRELQARLLGPWLTAPRIDTGPTPTTPA